MTTAKKRIVNAHMHVFTGDSVPPYLAKTLIMWPFYFLINTRWLISLFRKYYQFRFKKNYTEEKHIWEKRQKQRRKMNRKYIISHHWYLDIPYRIIITWLTIQATLYFLECIEYVFALDNKTFDWIDGLRLWLRDFYLYYDIHPLLKAIWVIAVLGVIRWSRRFLLMILTLLFPILKKMMGKKTLELISRYIMLGRFAFYHSQAKIAHRALDQLPPGSGLVLLPMDMEFMEAGKSRMPERYLAAKNKLLAKNWEDSDFSDVFKFQMRELWDFVRNDTNTAPKEPFYPFLFVDPRRMAKEKEAFFDYEIRNGKMVLKPCFIKTYMEDRRFSGFKIYPALGYYPFDLYLLPIWRYAAENQIPITSHCIHGTIFYRGSKKKEWNYHPVFKQSFNEDTYEPKLLPQTKNVDFQINFTHPLNYLCLLEESFLKLYLERIAGELESSSRLKEKAPGKLSPWECKFRERVLKEVFGYTGANMPLATNLSDIKICLAHYGGEEEWLKYLESDRHVYSLRLMRDPKEAIKFMENSKGIFSWEKINDLWDFVDWYSLICSLMIKYPNMYADLSYIISKKSIYPLLKFSLEKGENYPAEQAAFEQEPDIHKKSLHYTGKNKLRSRILWGTDFYVVRNHKSDKDLFIETKTLLSEEDFDLIARENPHFFLCRK